MKNSLINIIHQGRLGTMCEESLTFESGENFILRELDVVIEEYCEKMNLFGPWDSPQSNRGTN